MHTDYGNTTAGRVKSYRRHWLGAGDRAAKCRAGGLKPCRAAVYQPDRAAEPRGQTAVERRLDLLQRSRDHPSRWFLMIEHNDEWAVSRRYMSLETLAGLCEKPNVSVALPAA
jgi:hypothetical protein